MMDSNTSRSADTLPLPKDITNKIDEFVCKRLSNKKQSGNIVIRVNTAETAEKCETEVVAWILECLSDKRFDNVTDDMEQFLWNIVVGTQHNDDDPEDDGVLKNQLVVAIHLMQHESWILYRQKMDDCELVTLDESPPIKELTADEVLHSLTFEPKCVNGIGVSAVSNNYMAELWEEIISKERNTMSGSGKGYMVHPMWQRFNENVGWQTIREKSFNFGWKNYHPVE